jgi:hypothetical protein
MMRSAIEDLLYAVAAAVLLTAAAWLWKRAQPRLQLKRAWTWFWTSLHRRQLEEIAELRKDVDALLSVLDHWVTPGAGDKQRQFEFMAQALSDRGKRGISEADMRVARLVDNRDY